MRSHGAAQAPTGCVLIRREAMGMLSVSPRLSPSPQPVEERPREDKAAPASQEERSYLNLELQFPASRL